MILTFVLIDMCIWSYHCALFVWSTIAWLHWLIEAMSSNLSFWFWIGILDSCSTLYNDSICHIELSILAVCVQSITLLIHFDWLIGFSGRSNSFILSLLFCCWSISMLIYALLTRTPWHLYTWIRSCISCSNWDPVLIFRALWDYWEINNVAVTSFSMFSSCFIAIFAV